MKLGTKGRYAVMAMVDLAQNTKKGEDLPVCLSDIAQRQNISLPYLEQLFAKLRKKGLVIAFRGPGGGYCLGNEAHNIYIADVILAVDESIQTVRCDPKNEKGCQKSHARCMTHDLWAELGNHIYRYLRSVSLGDVCQRRVIDLKDKV